MFSYAIACSCNIIFGRVIIFLSCVLNVFFHVGHVAVANFEVVFIEQLVKFEVSSKVLINCLCD